MATTVTKNIKPIAEYQQWAAVDITDGDVLGIYESLGGRAAESLTIESIGGATTFQINVVKKVYREYNSEYQGWVGTGAGALGPSPILVKEIVESKPTITVESGATQIWTKDEIRVSDIKIISKSSGLKITVT